MCATSVGKASGLPGNSGVAGVWGSRCGPGVRATQASGVRAYSLLGSGLGSSRGGLSWAGGVGVGEWLSPPPSPIPTAGRGPERPERQRHCSFCCASPGAHGVAQPGKRHPTELRHSPWDAVTPHSRLAVPAWSLRLPLPRFLPNP